MSGDEYEEARSSLGEIAEEEYENQESGDGVDSTDAPLLSPDEVIDETEDEVPEDVGAQFDEPAIEVFFGQSNYLADAAEAYANALEQYDLEGEAVSLAEDWRDYAESLRNQADREMGALEDERDEVLYTSAAQANFAARMLEQGTSTIREAAEILGAEENQPPRNIGVRPADTVMAEFPYGALERIRDAANRVDPEGNFEHTDEYGQDGENGVAETGSFTPEEGSEEEEADVLDVERVNAGEVTAENADVEEANVEEVNVQDEDYAFYDPRGWF